MRNLKLLFSFLLIAFFSASYSQTRSDVQALIDNIATGVPNTALKVRTALNAIADGSAQTGDIKEIDVNTSYIASNFDATGLGKNERLGWAICNGNNGTRNRGGRVAIQYNASTYSVLGAVGGEATHVLTTEEIPSHSHTIRASVSTSGGAGASSVSNTNNNASAMTTNTAGGGQAHNNMQPYIVTLFIMKL